MVSGRRRDDQEKAPLFYAGVTRGFNSIGIVYPR
jgi:hypothetical protein